MIRFSLFFIALIGYLSGFTQSAIFPYGNYYMPPKYGKKNSNGKHRLDLVGTSIQPDSIGTEIIKLEELDVKNLNCNYKDAIDTIIQIQNDFYIIGSRDGKYSYGTFRFDLNKGRLFWKYNGLSFRCYSIDQVLGLITLDQSIEPLFSPLYTAEEAKNFKNLKSPYNMTENEVLALLTTIRSSVKKSEDIKYNLEGYLYEKYRVSRFYRLSVEGSAFVEMGYSPNYSDEKLIKYLFEKYKTNEEIKSLMKLVWYID